MKEIYRMVSGDTHSLIRRVWRELHDGRLPLSLFVEWNQNGQSAWATCNNARDMLSLLGYVDRKTAVRAACICARTSLQYIPTGEDRPLRAIESAEAWCRGEAKKRVCFEAANAAHDSVVPVVSESVFYAASAAKHAALITCAIAPVRAAMDSSACADDAALAADLHDQRHRLINHVVLRQRVFDETIIELAHAVRRTADCPTGDRLAAYVS